MERFGSVWPAVFAHAVPLSVGNLLLDGAPDRFWTWQAISWAAMLAAAIIVRKWRTPVQQTRP